MVTDGVPVAGVADRPMLQAKLVASRMPITVPMRLAEITGWGIDLPFIGCDIVCCLTPPVALGFSAHIAC